MGYTRIMLKKFVLFVILVVVIISTQEVFVMAKDDYNILVYINGKEIDVEDREIEDVLSKTFENHREMPAFGVALHDETVEAKKQGVWLEIVFKENQVHNEMPYDKLLINIDPEFTGCNLIRFYDNQYSGRCFYVDLCGNMENLYNAIKRYVR